MARTVTIRLLDGKEEVYDKFKALVTQDLHSDVCYVTTMLMETFNNAVTQKPSAEQAVTMKFVKQNVQINMGCTFQYYTKKARRTPQDPFTTITDPHNLVPEVVSQFPSLTKEAQQFWINELRSQGFTVDPPVSTPPKPRTTIKQKLKALWRSVKQKIHGWRGKLE